MKLARHLRPSLTIAFVAFAVVLIFDHSGYLTLVVAAFFAILFVWLYQLSKLAAFRPYEVAIRINFAALCEDLALQWVEDEPRKDSVFTAITPALFQHEGYERKHKYMSGMFIDAEVPCAKISWTPGPGSHLGERPRFFFRPYGDVYQFGVLVDPEWWSHRKDNASPEVRHLSVRSDGEIVLAVLPASYIPDHARHEYETVSLFYPFERKQRQWKAKLSALGWSVGDYNPSYIQHRYINIKCFFF